MTVPDPQDRLILNIHFNQHITIQSLISALQPFQININNAYIYFNPRSPEKSGLYINTDIDNPRRKKLKSFDEAANANKLERINQQLQAAKASQRKRKKTNTRRSNPRQEGRGRSG